MKVNNIIRNDPYFRWLYDLATSILHYGRHDYNLLILDLHRKKFRWFIPNDDNRAYEAKNLREIFCREEGIIYNNSMLDEEASMLELILALAFRCESIMIDSLDNMTISDWFWKILHNVGLDKFTDDDYYYLGGFDAVNKILDIIIDRRYSKSGLGGLFPLKKPKKDQRKVELWYQMCHFLTENYYLDDMVI